MKSIGIWYTSKEEEKIKELHFNFWKVSNSRFLDIGLKLEKHNGGKLKIYLPSEKIINKDFEDIVPKFIYDPILINSIFNENYGISHFGSERYHEVRELNENKVLFVINEISEKDIIIEKIFEGTLINIHLKECEKESYYRFRLKGEYIDSLFVTNKPTNSVLQSAFLEEEMISFRVNEIRNLNRDIIEKIREEGKIPKIEKLHFFFICSNRENIIGSHKSFLTCRDLETGIWNKYVEKDESKNRYLAYHWKEKEQDSLTILIKTQYEKSNKKMILTYILIIIGISILSNFAYDLLKYIVSSYD